MNQPPPRHPLFVAIACIALAGAWGTGAYETESGDSAALVAASTPTPQDLGAECPGPRGPTRALCLFQASRLSDPADPASAVEMPRVAVAAVKPVPQGTRIATHQRPSEPLMP